MIWNNVELFNVSEIKEESDGSLRVYRFTEKARRAFDDGIRDYAVGVGEMTTGCEIRFVGEGADVTLSTLQDSGMVEIYRGDYFVRCERVYGDKDVTIRLRSDLGTDRHNISGIKSKFSSSVWRIIFDHDCTVRIKSIEPTSEIRPPKASEVPGKRIIAYGSSITHSACSVLYTNSYIYTIARKLSCDILCKGMGGSCFVQKDVADYIAAYPADAALLELGINMIDTDLTADDLAERADYIVKKTLASGKKVILISLFTSHQDLIGSAYGEKNLSLVKALDKVYEENKCENLYYINGKDIVDDFTLLTSDLIHPSPYGHITMGTRIAEKLTRDMGFVL